MHELSLNLSEQLWKSYIIPIRNEEFVTKISRNKTNKYLSFELRTERSVAKVTKKYGMHILF